MKAQQWRPPAPQPIEPRLLPDGSVAWTKDIYEIADGGGAFYLVNVSRGTCECSEWRGSHRACAHLRIARRHAAKERA